MRVFPNLLLSALMTVAVTLPVTAVAANADASANWTDVVSSNGSTVTPRHETGGVVYDGKLWIFGGRGNRPVESYDPATRQWTDHGQPPFEIFLEHFFC